MFIKDFVIEEKAQKFAREHKGRVTIRYDLDSFGKMIKYYRVVF